MLLGGGGTMGKSTCVTFAAYQSGRWKCHRYEVDGSHSYGHYFYTSEIAYHTIDGVDAYCVEPNTSSLGGQYYTAYTAEEASSSSYWKLELDDLQRSHIQKILAFGYPQVDYGYSRQVQYAATQVLIWEVVFSQPGEYGHQVLYRLRPVQQGLCRAGNGLSELL